MFSPMYIVLPIYYITYKVSVFIDHKIVCLEEILVIKDPSKTVIQLAKGFHPLRNAQGYTLEHCQKLEPPG